MLFALKPPQLNQYTDNDKQKLCDNKNNLVAHCTPEHVFFLL